MKIEFEADEARELVVFLIERMGKEAGLAAADAAALRKWRTSLKPGSEAMRDLTSKLNADLARVIETQKRSPIVRADWQ